jgi:nicotinate-nucleotide adenylyltransferase
MQRLGILGGTFDPIHHAHLAIADEARVVLRLDQVLFVPAAQQPFKAQHWTSAAHRLAMVEAAVASNPHFSVSALELQRPGPSYTADTLESLHEIYPDAAFWFILGADALRWLPRWHAIERLSTLTRFAVVDRPTVTLDLAQLEAEQPLLHNRIERIAGPHLDISSTEIRARIAAGLPVRYLVPDAVADYIAVHNVY